MFRCSECPNAFCEDHLPIEQIKLNEEGRNERFELLGFRKPTQAYYIRCSPDCALFAKEREEMGVEKAIKNAVARKLELAKGDDFSETESEEEE